MIPDHAESEPPATPADARDSYAGWEEAYDDNVEWLYRMLYARVGNQSDAEDLTSEVFLAALRPLRITASRREVRAYLKVTARSVLAQHWRRHFKLEITRLDDDGGLTQPQRDDALDSQVARLVLDIIDTLTERHRMVLDLRFLQGMPLKDVARTMGISVANTKVLQHRALTAAGRAGVGATDARV